MADRLYYRGEMMVISNVETEVLDEEWIALILEAKEQGLSIEMVRQFFNQQKV
ncbi:anti-repressor SinI family protein [Neobacillus dielmonensis]|uniref:anti-repressor SinI family protein n=1 Tax=Neobacillus dielmonensis TaxID=1347369 RepID=UPI000A6BA88A|nr:anti-repressor SinI family protein [Neobacillus dielmonensis]